MERLVRSFVAVELSPEVRGRALQLIEKLRRASAKVRWVRNDNLHLTLKFLGEVESVEIARICDAMQRAVADLESFDLEFHAAGAFPDAVNPRTIWVGVRAGAEAMIALHRRVDDALENLGFRVEGRRFRPHVTVGRVRDTRHGKRELKALLDEFADYRAGITHVEDVTLFASRLTEDGPEYEALGRAELRQAPR